MSERGPQESNPHRALVGLAVIVAAVVAVLFIVHRLDQAAQLQDCVASGRTNCAPIETIPWTRRSVTPSMARGCDTNPDDFKGAEAFVEVIGLRARPNNL